MRGHRHRRPAVIVETLGQEAGEVTERLGGVGFVDQGDVVELFGGRPPRRVRAVGEAEALPARCPTGGCDKPVRHRPPGPGAAGQAHRPAMG